MPSKNVAFNVSLALYKSDNTLIANPGTITAMISKDYGDWAAVGTVTEEDSTYGQIKLALTATEMNADVIDLHVVDNTAGCVPWTASIYTTPVPANVTQWLGTAVAAPDTAGIPKVNVQEIAGGDVEGNNATLKLKHLDVTNDTAAGVIFKSTGAGAGCHGLLCETTSTSVDTAGFMAQGTKNGSKALCTTSGPGFAAVGAGTGAGIVAEGGASDGVDIDANLAGDVTGKVLGGGTGTITGTGARASLTDNAITSAKFDNSTAFPLKAEDANTTYLARQALLQDVDNEVDYIHSVVDSIAVTGSALSMDASSFTKTLGGTEVNDYTATSIANGTTHQIPADANGDIDCYYEFNIGALGVPVRANITGRLVETLPLAESIDLYVYNWTGAAWELFHTAVFSGTNTTTNTVHTDTLYGRHVGTGGDDGKVRIRFYSTALTATSSILHVDQILVDYAESVAANVTSILADTNELQTDWTNGGRLDLLLDAVALESSIQSALTAIADIPTVAEFEARSIVAANYATAANLATVDTVVDGIKVTTDKLDTTLELDGVGPEYQFTAAAMDQAPAGAGALTSGDVEQLRYKLDIDGTQTEPSAEGSVGHLATVEQIERTSGMLDSTYNRASWASSMLALGVPFHDGISGAALEDIINVVGPAGFPNDRVLGFHLAIHDPSSGADTDEFRRLLLGKWDAVNGFLKNDGISLNEPPLWDAVIGNVSSTFFLCPDSYTGGSAGGTLTFDLVRHGYGTNSLTITIPDDTGLPAESVEGLDIFPSADGTTIHHWGGGRIGLVTAASKQALTNTFNGDGTIDTTTHFDGSVSKVTYDITGNPTVVEEV